MLSGVLLVGLAVVVAVQWIPLTTTATSAVRINEIQSVNVGAGG